MTDEAEARELLAMKERVAKFEEAAQYFLNLFTGKTYPSNVIGTTEQFDKFMSVMDILREAKEGT